MACYITRPDMLHQEAKVKRPIFKKEYLYIQKRFPINKDKHKYILEN